MLTVGIFFSFLKIYASLGSVRVFLKEIRILFSKELCIKLIGINLTYVYNVTKIFIVNKMFYYSKESL